MTVVMDREALTAFLHSDFGQVAADFVVERADAAGVTLRLPVAERHLRPGGTVSGPSIFALADVAMYLAILSRIGPVALAVTTSASVDFMRKPAAGRDLLAQLIYGFRVSVLFALALTASGVVLGVVTGAIQGFFGGRTDLAFQRFIEIWGSMPELYLLIIFSAVLAPSVSLLLVLLSLFGWMGLSDYVRAEFLRNRQLDYVKSARALGVGNGALIWRHLLPNSMTPVVTFLPFRMSVAILALTSLDFLGLGVPPDTPSLGELLSQGKNSIDAWWISLSTFAVLVVTLLLLTFMGDALRDALDPRKAAATDAAPAVDAKDAA